MKHFLISVLILLCAAFHADAQSIKVNTRFGKVSKEEVEEWIKSSSNIDVR